MEVSSEHAAPLPEPVAERRTYSHRLVPGTLVQQVVKVSFLRMLGLTLGSILSGRSGHWVGASASAGAESLTVLLWNASPSRARSLWGPGGRGTSSPLCHGLGRDRINAGCGC